MRCTKRPDGSAAGGRLSGRTNHISTAAAASEPASSRNDAPVPQSVVDEIVASDGFVAGRAVSL